MHSYRHEAIAAHNGGCIDQAVWDAEENMTDAGREFTAEEAQEEGFSYLMEGLSSCRCGDYASAFQTACLCGCGEVCFKNYKPGHDARHVSYVARSYVESLEWSNHGPLYKALAKLPSVKLVAKAEAMIERLIAARGY